MVGRLVEKNDIGILEHGTGKSQPHLPTTRKGGERRIEHGLQETELTQLSLEVLNRNTSTSLSELVKCPSNDGLHGIGRVKIVLNEDGLDFRVLGETLNLLVVDGTHEPGLSGTVGPTKTVKH